MTKEELVRRVSQNTRYKQSVVSKILDESIGVIMDAVADGDEVRFLGFGSFSRVQRAARVGRNPATNEAIPIPEKLIPVFRPGETFKRKVRE